MQANFVEPAHDKQGFEWTIALSRLEARLIVIQKAYWFVVSFIVSRNFQDNHLFLFCSKIFFIRYKNCHLVGYSDKRPKNRIGAPPNQDSVAQPSDRSKSSSHSTPDGSNYASRVESHSEIDRRPTPIPDITGDRGSREVYCHFGDSQHAAADEIKNKDMDDSSYKRVNLVFS